MDGEILNVGIFLAATFAAALIAGLAGFAFGLIAAAAWLHILTPLQTTSLIVGYGLLVQGLAVWTLRRAISWSRLWPFLLGAALGVPLGVFALAAIDASPMRRAVGAILMLFAGYSLARPALKPIPAGGLAADACIGLCNGALGGMTGLAGIIVVIWSGLRGWTKDVQRAVFQPVGVATFAMTALWLGASGTIRTDLVKLFLLGLPLLILGTWLGLKLYGRLDESRFRQMVLILLLLSGISLVIKP
jgi:uncharacterized membrane protein YfcA